MYSEITSEKIRTDDFHNNAEINIKNLSNIIMEAAKIAIPNKIYNSSKTYFP